MHLATYLTLLDSTESMLGDGFTRVARRYANDAEIATACTVMAEQCTAHRGRLTPLIEAYGGQLPAGTPVPNAAPTARHRPPDGLQHELHNLHALAGLANSSWTICRQAAQTMHDMKLLTLTTQCQEQTQQQLTWLEAQLDGNTAT